MNRLHLEPPTSAHKTIVLDYKQDFLNSGDSIDGSAGLAWASSFEEWLQSVQENSNPQTVRTGCVPTSVYLAFDCETGQLVGMIDIRHPLNESLGRFGGHIGYSIRQSKRRKGYASEMLFLALAKCRHLGLDRVLLTCHKDNIASARTMLHCGAILQDELHLGQFTIQRYWITL